MTESECDRLGTVFGQAFRIVLRQEIMVGSRPSESGLARGAIDVQAEIDRSDMTAPFQAERSASDHCQSQILGERRMHLAESGQVDFHSA